MLLRHIFILCFFAFFNNVSAQVTVKVDSVHVPMQVAEFADVYVNNDSSDTANILSKKFVRNTKSVPVFLEKKNDVWLRLRFQNETNADLKLNIQYANIPLLQAYRLNGSQLCPILETGSQFPFEQRIEKTVTYSFNLKLAKGETGTYYIHVVSEHPVELPIAIHSESSLKNADVNQSAIIGAYFGILLAIFLYNLFLYFATSDRSYLIYVSYLLALILAQAIISGWAFKFFWPELPVLNRYAVLVSSGLAGFAGVCFGLSFLQTAKYTPLMHKFFIAFAVFYAIAVLLAFTPFKNAGYTILNFNGMAAGSLLLFTSAYISRAGYRPAKYYLFAWSAFLIGLIIFILRNLGVLPINGFTTYTLYLGSAVEAVLLSIALADRINVLRQEKELSQRQTLEALEENQKLVKEQNIVLEQKVSERTAELETALVDLKDAQAQLVNAEKMASLGQLTAGIAHEINNPINFVKSNIKPLQLDIKDLIEVIDEYDTLHNTSEEDLQKKLKDIDALKKQIDISFVKQELHSLIKGIEDGAERTAEIVRGLRTFSRLDESEIKTVNIHDGLDSTLVLLKNSMPHHLKIEKQYDAHGDIECLPGKLNQVFMNILNNAIQAITAKPVQGNNENILLRTEDVGDDIRIHIKDSGGGMPEEVRNRIFEPFFTTKDVGEGTGLGLAIVYKIIEQHHGKIEVTSTIGEGTEFIITLPRKLPENSINIP